jgi:hypothetical protein
MLKALTVVSARAVRGDGGDLARSYSCADELNFLRVQGSACAEPLNGLIQFAYCPKYPSEFDWSTRGLSGRRVRYSDETFDVTYTALALGFGYAAFSINLRPSIHQSRCISPITSWCCGTGCGGIGCESRLSCAPLGASTEQAVARGPGFKLQPGSGR